MPCRDLLTLPHDLDDLLAGGLESDAQLFQSLGRHALALVNESEKQVLSADVVVV